VFAELGANKGPPLEPLGLCRNGRGTYLDGGKPLTRTTVGGDANDCTGDTTPEGRAQSPGRSHCSFFSRGELTTRDPPPKTILLVLG